MDNQDELFSRQEMTLLVVGDTLHTRESTLSHRWRWLLAVGVFVAIVLGVVLYPV